jgi:hypothetical protein
MIDLKPRATVIIAGGGNFPSLRWHLLEGDLFSFAPSCRQMHRMSADVP